MNLTSPKLNRHYLLLALIEAEKRRGFCAPNPAVGAVIVKDNQILATGSHFAAGHAHAEIAAIKQLNSVQLKDATIYVTLVPCCHFGKTPPCTDAIIQAGIKKVVFAVDDPNPQVHGKSFEILQHAGIIVETESVPEIETFYQSYFYWWEFQKPFITAKIALTLDGKSAYKDKKPYAISNETANHWTHQQRQKSDALLTTVQTVLHDNPQLNARVGQEIIAKPVFVIDKDLQIAPNSRVFTTAKNVNLFHDAHLRNTEAFKNSANLVPIMKKSTHLDLQQIKSHLGQLGFHDIWLEAGGNFLENAMRENFIDKLHFIIAPHILGEKGLTAFTDEIKIKNQAKQINWDTLGDNALCSISFW